MVKIGARELRKKYQKFFEERGHKWIPSVSLVPENDPSTLFISAGMHPLVPYLMGESHPLGRRLVNIQECLRTGDIDEVGDTFHHTWFEMFGNWSLGDYFKQEAISWSFEFLTKVLNIDPEKFHVTCFAGDKDAPKDEESAQIWKKLGISENRIHFLPKKDNWWGPVGDTGPCGPDTEMFIDVGLPGCGSNCKPNCFCGKYIEIWNDVFMQYNKSEKGEYTLLEQQNVDTGMGVERTLAVLLGFEDNYLTNIWQPIIKKVEKISGKFYQKENNKRPMRIIADHLRSAVFVIADGVLPSNKEQGYVLRRLTRRAVVQGKQLGLEKNFTKEIALAILDNQDNYAGVYLELNENRDKILETLEIEESKFRGTLNRGLKEFLRLVEEKKLIGLNAFNLYQTYGFPLELIIEEAERVDYKLSPKFRNDFQQAAKGHQKLSRTAVKGKFKGGLSGYSPKMIQYHTATHLLQAALRSVLGNNVIQVGSNITEKRLRFDFTHPEKPTSEEIKKVEDLVNQKIRMNLLVGMKIMLFNEAINRGAAVVSGKAYPNEVKVYSIGDPDASGLVFSKEVCGGPHVGKTGELGKFKIEKEESCGAGKRRIYGILKEGWPVSKTNG